MEEAEAPTVNQPPSDAPGFAIEIEADPTSGFAAIQNSVPVIRSLKFTNNSENALEEVRVQIACNPVFAGPAHFRFARLMPGECRKIQPVDLAPDHSFLSTLREAVTATVSVTVLGSAGEIAVDTRSIEVLAYDQWAGTRALPELLAAFSMPNNPAVDVLVASASRLLRAQHSELSMDGYQSKNRELVWKQVSAIYSTIASANLQYSEPPASFGSDGQKIRTPDRVMETGVGTCLDLAMLFSSCLEQAGLRPVVMFKEGHAWIGVWLHDNCFATPVVDDVQSIRKRVASGEFLVFETTGVAQHPSRRPSLRIATEQGQQHLQDDSTFRFAVDVRRSRESRIKPLPSRVDGRPIAASTAVEQPAGIEQMPALPPLDPEALAAVDLDEPNTPEGRLTKWKSKLLDLTLRNRLLNFKPTKSSLKIVAPELEKLEDTLSEGVEFRIRPLPRIMDGADPRSSEIYETREGKTALNAAALDALAKHELICNVPPDKLDDSLLTIDSAARTGLEEGGANTLYLALGFLCWTEAERAETSHLAPILLVPVTLTRQSVKSGYRLTRHDDEAIANPTLIQMLKASFGLTIRGIDTLPTDDKGIDVVKVLQSFRLAIGDIPKWEVRDDAVLGIFSFTKYLMWKDLQDRTDALKTNRVVKHLIENPGTAFHAEHDVPRDGSLDDRYKPQELFTPLMSDSSQLEAICTADLGRDIVIQGPPGTGKSQTITNLIAHSLAKGKTVLFVSEKMAALEVVHRRLNSIGLGPFCLELHSAKAKKSEVVQQLGRALDVTKTATPEEWNREAERLARLRIDLNALVTSLHRKYRNGLTVFEATGTCIELSDVLPSPMPWTNVDTHSADELEVLRETVRRMAALASGLGDIHDNPLRQIGQTDWSPTWEDTLLAQAAKTEGAARELLAATRSLAHLLGVSAESGSFESLAALDKLVDSLFMVTTVPAGLVRRAHEPEIRVKVQVIAQHGAARTKQWARIGDGWTADLARVDGSAFRQRWRLATTHWWPKSYFAKRSIAGEIRTCREDLRRPTADQIVEMIEPLIEVNKEDHALRGLEVEAQALLEDSYTGVTSDWTSLAQHEHWAGRYADAVLAFAGGDPSAAAQLRASLERWVTTDRAAVGPITDNGRALAQYRAAWRSMREQLDGVTTLASARTPLTGPPDSSGAIERILSHMSNWKLSARRIRPWCLWQGVRNNALEQGLNSVVEALESGHTKLDAVETYFEYSYRTWWLKRAVDSDPVLRAFSSADHERKIREFRTADAKFQRLIERYIVASLSSRVPSAITAVVSADSEVGRIRREMQKQRRHMPVRQLLHGIPTLLQRLKPCLLMSPLSVAQYLDAGFAPFDMVVFDEASQIPVWDAVGAIARGKQLVVVGDPKQLPPTNFFMKADDGDGVPTGDGQVDELESILDECLGSGLPKIKLKWHFRSRHESLITFSNMRYYDGELITFPSPVTSDVAVRFNRVTGIYDRGGSRTNRLEAEAVVDAIASHVKDGARSHLTIGVVTFNQPQQALIESILDMRRRIDNEVDQAIASRTHEPLFIKNLENVQGDERDMILFSTTYGPDLAGKMTMNFGPLNGDGGHRRLNVAITRAREGVELFSSMLPEQIDLSRVRAAGVRDFKNYLEFALRGPRALIEESVVTGLDADSPFERAVMAKLRDKGWVVHAQVGCSGYRIDIGVVDPRAPGRYLLGVECDGATYHSAKEARDRDRLRQQVLEGLGWRIHRIWSTNWWTDPDNEIAKIVQFLESLLEEPETPATRPAHDVVAHNAAAPPNGQEKRVVKDLFAAERNDAISAPSLGPEYEPTQLPSYDSNRFHQLLSESKIVENIYLVIQTEGPVSETVLFQRVARAWGLQRTGSRIVERLRQLVPRNVKRTKEGQTAFYWPVGVVPSEWRGFRVAGESEDSKRAIEDICAEELGCIVCEVLNQAGSTPSDDVARAVCRVLGIGRTSAAADARVASVIKRLLSQARLTEADGYLRLVK